MKEFFKKLLSEEDWLIHEKGFNQSTMSEQESIFTLGNGYMGSRGILEEIPYDSSPGTYIAGVYDKSISQVSELVNVPNPVDLRVTAEGEKIDIKGMYIHKHHRILDLKRGFLFRHNILANSKKERFDYKSVRFISSANKHIGVMKVWVRAMDAPTILTVQDNINVSVRNKGVLTEGRKKHFQVKEVRSQNGINYACAKTQQTGISLGCSTHLSYRHNDDEHTAPDQSFDIRIKKGEEIVLTKTFCLKTSRHLSQQRLRDTTIKSLRVAARQGFDYQVRHHIRSFQRLWRGSDVVIEGDSDAQKSMRFNIYHMLIASNPDDKDTSIGARTLSGEGYRGHIFWDTEIFLLPFYTFIFPETAKNLLHYRYNRLDAARKIAKSKGYKGALFPWESADTGEDETPRWHKDLDGSIIEIHTQDYEHHIVADVVYGLWQYYKVTGDSKFMNKYGAEIIFETARFWASRVEENKRSRQFEIKHVMGPDEFHGDVDNNAYTNCMAKWNLLTASDLYDSLESDHVKNLKKLSTKIKLKKSEIQAWKHIADRMYIPISKDRKIIESFDGYFKKRDIVITRLDKHFMPEFPPNLPLNKLGQTQIVKQLDAAMLAYLVPNMFDDEITANTINYYEKRTVHKSSLSPSINAIMNLRSGNTTRAYQYFLYALNADLKRNQSNVSEGIHAASLGGCWQAAVNGFGGVSIKDGMLSFEPLFPEYWRSLQFSLKWKSYELSVKITHKDITISARNKRTKKPLLVKIFGAQQSISPNKAIIVKHRG